MGNILCNCFGSRTQTGEDKPPETPARLTSDPNRHGDTMPHGASAQGITVGSGSVSFDNVVSQLNSNSYTENTCHGGRAKPLPIVDSDGVISAVGQTVLVAMYRYESRAEGDLSFDKDDQMILIDDANHDWWYVQHRKTGAAGYVPRNFVAKEETVESEEWYAGKIARSQAERLVFESNLPRGTFLVRQRETDDSEMEYALTIRDSEGKKDTVKHYKIKRLHNGGYFISARRTFESLQALVAFYKSNGEGLCYSLTFPAPRIAPSRPDLSSDTQKNWEIPTDQLALKQKLGSGNFGDVWYGKWRGVVEVAVKTLKQGTMSQEAFLQEAAIMKQCHHKNLVKLYAVCSQQEPLYIVTEFMCNGSLLDYLRDQGASLDITGIVDMCAQIASGMGYLEDRRMVHRDLAARNVLVGDYISGVPVVKVADFGLARLLMDEDIYEPRMGAKFPIKWTSPEAALRGAFTVKSDVWSYGILMYELITGGSAPYPGMNNREVIDQVERGYRMPRHMRCPVPFYEVMLQCWSAKPDCRPTFEYLYHFFDDYYAAAQPSYAPQSTS